MLLGGNSRKRGIIGSHVRDHRIRRKPGVPADPPARPRAARVPRLRLRRVSRSSRTGSSPRSAPWATSASLEDAAALNTSQATTGVGHTRWATHGRVCAENAHPLTGCIDGDIDLVLNGIVENYRELKASLLEEGHEFSSETDAEVIAHLVERHYEGDLVAAVRAAYAELEGHFAFVVLHREHPSCSSARGTSARCSWASATGDVPRVDGRRVPARHAPDPADRGRRDRRRDA